MKITPDQVGIGQAVSCLMMSSLAFIVAFITAAIFLGWLVWCIAKHDDWAAKITLSIVNGFSLSLLHIIFKHVFPTPLFSEKDGKAAPVA